MEYMKHHSLCFDMGITRYTLLLVDITFQAVHSSKEVSVYACAFVFVFVCVCVCACVCVRACTCTMC